MEITGEDEEHISLSQFEPVSGNLGDVIALEGHDYLHG